MWHDGEGRPLHPHTSYCVGGNTKFYGAALFRLRERDFDELRHYEGVSPAWPIGYRDLEPYYAEAERLYHVHGERGADPPSRGRRGPILIRRCRTSPESATCTTTSPPRAPGRSTCRSG